MSTNSAPPHSFSSQPTDGFLQAARGPVGSDRAQVLQDMLSVHCCPRCCLRFLGSRGELHRNAYGEAVPFRDQLLQHLQLSQQGSSAEEKSASAEVQPEPAEAVLCTSERALSTLGPSSVANCEAAALQPSPRECAASSQHNSTCSACLGVLQSLDSSLVPAAGDLISALIEPPGGQGHWQAMDSGAASSILDSVRQQAHTGRAIALEVSIPGSTVLRQLAVLRWLQQRHPSLALGKRSATTGLPSVVDLKEAVRLGLGARLHALTGLPISQEGDLKISLAYVHPASASEPDFLFGGVPARSVKHRKRKHGYSRRICPGRAATDAMWQMAAALPADRFAAHVCIPPGPPCSAVHLLVHSRCSDVLIGGYYTKLRRDVSNSPFFIDDQRKGRTSVEEEVDRFLQPLMRHDSRKFISAGREDMDVRMLGQGRPFVLQLANARHRNPSAAELLDVQAQLAAADCGVQASCLQVIEKDMLRKLKEGEQDKQKSYRALCLLPCPVTAEVLQQLTLLEELVLRQYTPTRVSHRRALMERQRSVYSMRCQAVKGQDHQVVLHLRTQAGTYIKEFVHGDEDRTKPSIGSLLGQTQPAACLELDVMEVHMDWLASSP